MNSEAQYIDLYQQCRDLIFANAPVAMNAVRDAAFENFKKLGFPNKHAVKKDAAQSKIVERYKYTDVAKLFEPDFGVNLNRLKIPVDPYEAFRCDVPNLSTLLYFVVNDSFYGDAAAKNLLQEGVFIGSMKERQDIVAKYYATLAKTDEDAVTALNTMLAQDGLLVYVPKGVVIRVLIVAEEGAEVKLLFCDHSADDRNFLATQVIEVFAGANAKIDMYCLEETHAKNVRVSNVYVNQERDSRVRHNVITLHNGITRNKLDLTLSGDGAECTCNGCVIADKQQHVDNNTLIVHNAQHCTSNELYKYVLDEKATGAFAGRVLVSPGAQKTTSQMTNQNLTTTREAHMYTQPMLEIYADDVKCAHGSTVGQLSDAALFYMRQRGIPEAEARMLLQVAFIREVIDQISLVPLRDRLHYLVEKRFRGELNKCEGCKLCR